MGKCRDEKASAANWLTNQTFLSLSVSRAAFWGGVREIALHDSCNLGAHRIVGRSQRGGGEMRIPRGRRCVFVTE